MIFEVGKVLGNLAASHWKGQILDVFHLRPTIEYFWASSSSDFQGGKGFGKSCCLSFGRDKFWMFFKNFQPFLLCARGP